MSCKARLSPRLIHACAALLVPQALLASTNPELASQVAAAKAALDAAMAMVRSLLESSSPPPEIPPPVHLARRRPSPRRQLAEGGLDEEMEEEEALPTKRVLGPPAWLEDGSLAPELVEALRAAAPWKKRKQADEEDEQDLAEQGLV